MEQKESSKFDRKKINGNVTNFAYSNNSEDLKRKKEGETILTHK
jgi:hypothetical protein